MRYYGNRRDINKRIMFFLELEEKETPQHIS